MRIGLGAKFTCTLLLILAATMAANTLYFLHTSTRIHEHQLVERGRALGRLISLISPEAILGFDYLQLNAYTREVSSQPDIVYGVIVSPQGVPISSYINTTDPKIRQLLQQDGTRELVNAIKQLAEREQWLTLEFPIVHNDVVLGRFMVGISRESLQEELRKQSLVQVLIFGALVVFLGLATYAVFRLNVLHPIRSLIAASHGVGRGQYHPVEVKGSDEMELLARAFNSMAEEVKREQAKLHRQANFDALTGLPNRMNALSRITLEISRARRSAKRFAVLFIDLDNFKNVNDSLGHAAGDQLLVDVGTRIQHCLRDSDSVARLGGDEFLVLLADVSLENEIERIAERLLKSICAPMELCGHRVVAHASVGIAIYPDNGETVEALMANADNAMYQAKGKENGSAMFFTDEMNVRLRDRMEMEQDLNAAIQLGQLALHFQPIVETSAHRHCGAEVLLRWKHPVKGFISPAEFIPLAESTGQIVEIGDWVLEQACLAWAKWHEAGIEAGYLGINISRIQFRKRFAKRLEELMNLYGIPANALGLEVTESVLLNDHQEVIEELGELRALGVRLFLDDFGTGYSALSYLKRFKFDVLKIDRSFISGLPGNPDDVSVVRAVLAMARGLDLRVVAEGVETREQLDFVTAQGCNFVQGYFFSRPLDEVAYCSYLRHRHERAEPFRLSAQAH